ncbi:MAG: P-loop NTPase [Candidatus Thermoplasmatota archaeon]
MIKIHIDSGKGGVGKSRMAVAIARKLKEKGMKIGILDADVNTPKLIDAMGIPTGQHEIGFDEEKLLPVEIEGMKVMSMQLLPDDDKAALFSGTRMADITNQLLDYVDWSGIDYLIIDMPPGTGEIPQTLFRRMSRDDCVILVTGPRLEELKDALRTIDMAKWFNVRIAGMIINFSYVTCPHGEKMYVGYMPKNIENLLRLNVIAEVPLLCRSNGGKVEDYINADTIIATTKRKFFFGR